MASSDPFVPASPAPVDPEDALADLEADFEGIATPPDVIVVPEDVPPIGRSWGFDFLGGGFRMPSSRASQSVHDLSTLSQWIEKCLRTSQGGCPIHPPDYGLPDPDALIGGVVGGMTPVSELEAEIKSALTLHPRISDVTDFTYTFDDGEEWVAVGFTVVLDDNRNLPFNTTLSATVAVSEFFNA